MCAHLNVDKRIKLPITDYRFPKLIINVKTDIKPVIKRLTGRDGICIDDNGDEQCVQLALDNHCCYFAVLRLKLLNGLDMFYHFLSSKYSYFFVALYIILTSYG